MGTCAWQGETVPPPMEAAGWAKMQRCPMMSQEGVTGEEPQYSIAPPLVRVLIPYPNLRARGYGLHESRAQVMSGSLTVRRQESDIVVRQLFNYG